MKVRVLTGLLILSTILNAAGVVFLVSFVNLRGHYKAVNRERNIMAHNLSVLRGAGVVNQVLQSERLLKRSFISHADGQEDVFGLMSPYCPTPTKEFTLAVYLHGMGSNYLEPFVCPQSEPVANAVMSRHPQTVFLSLSYGGEASWGNDKAMSDISQNIREVCQEFPVSRIVLIGTSMGGCTVLSYAALAPQDIKNKIVGVLSIESAGDLLELYNQSGHPALQPAMAAAFGGTPDKMPDIYKHKSFLRHIKEFPQQAKVAVISAREDDIVPPQLQKQIVESLDSQGIPAKLLEIDGGHGAPPAKVYLEGLDFVMAKPGG